MKKIKPSEARILQSLHKTPRSLTINELARKSNTSWSTTDKYLKKWKRKGLVKSIMKPAFSTKLNKRTTKQQWILKRDTLNKLIKTKY